MYHQQPHRFRWQNLSLVPLSRHTYMIRELGAFSVCVSLVCVFSLYVCA